MHTTRMEESIVEWQEERRQMREELRALQQLIAPLQEKVALVGPLQERVAHLDEQLLVCMKHTASVHMDGKQKRKRTVDRLFEYTEDLCEGQCYSINSVKFLVKRFERDQLGGAEIKQFIHMITYALAEDPELVRTVLDMWLRSWNHHPGSVASCWMDYDLRHTDVGDQLFDDFIVHDCDGDVQWEHDVCQLLFTRLCMMHDKTGTRFVDKVHRVRKQSLLHVFAIFDHCEAAKLALKSMTSTTRRAYDDEGQTAFHYAARESNSPVDWHRIAMLMDVFGSHPGVMAVDFFFFNKEGLLPIHYLAINYNVVGIIIYLVNYAICCHAEQISFGDKVQRQWKNKSGELLLTILNRMLVNAKAAGDLKDGVEDPTQKKVVISDFCNLDVLRKLIKLIVDDLDNTIQVVEDLAALLMEHVEGSEHKGLFMETQARWQKWVSDRRNHMI